MGALEVGDAADGAVLRGMGDGPFVVLIVFRVGVHLHLHATLRLADKPRHLQSLLRVLNPRAIGAYRNESYTLRVQDVARPLGPVRVLGGLAAGDGDDRRLCLAHQRKHLPECLCGHVLPVGSGILHAVRTIHVAAIGKHQ